MKNKEELRKVFKEQRKQISPSRRNEVKNLLAADLYPFLKGFEAVFSFASLPSEIDLWFLNEKLMQDQKLFLPRLEKTKLVYHKVGDLSSLSPSALGILEPRKEHKAATKEDEAKGCILVPGLVFDSQRHRLGYGLGHFDRFLKEHPSLFSIGIGFKEQLSHELLPKEAHDQRVELLALY